jgi:hypothetical protein
MPDELEVKDEHKEPQTDGGEEVSEDCMNTHEMQVAGRSEDGVAGFRVFRVANKLTGFL